MISILRKYNFSSTLDTTPSAFVRDYRVSHATTTATATRTATKTTGLDKKNNFACASRFFVHFAAVVARLQGETA